MTVPRLLTLLLFARLLSCQGWQFHHHHHHHHHHHKSHWPYDFFLGLGVNYGTLGDDLPSADFSLGYIRASGAGAVKIYDANPEILRALALTGIRVSIMVPNQDIPALADSADAANKWVVDNILPYYPATWVTYLLVGNEVLSDHSIADSTWTRIVPAMINLYQSLESRLLHNFIKIGTPLAMDALGASYPPSSGAFRDDIAETVMRPLMKFLDDTDSYYFVDAYPYFVWADNYKNVKLDYALFQASESDYYVDPGSGLTYTNMLDQMLDAVIAAMAKLGYEDVRLAIAETGWPNDCDVDQIGGNIYNAAIYNRNLAYRMRFNPGTPARPEVRIPTFVFSLYNENQKPGRGTERHWGLYYPSGEKVYPVDLTGRWPIWLYPELPEPENNAPYTGPLWCVIAGDNLNKTEVDGAVSWACSQGTGTCDAIQPGKECYRPDDAGVLASYAFNSYWQQFRNVGATCYFNGLAKLTAQDPSFENCKFRSSST